MITVHAHEAEHHGLAAVRIEVDAASAGMQARPFPGGDVLLLLNGPPGGPLLVMIADSRGNTNLEEVIRSQLVPRWSDDVAIGGSDHGVMVGADRFGLTFVSGLGRAAIAWFGTLVARPSGTLFVAVGAGTTATDAATILSNRVISSALETLTID
jgi:hypothetical protein